MSKFFLPIILIGISVATFFLFINPNYLELRDLKLKEGSYNEALANSKKLLEKRTFLLERYSQFAPEDLSRLNKLLPDNVDNIRLIIEIDEMAVNNGMSQLKNVKYDNLKEEKATTGPAKNLRVEKSDYETFTLNFSVDGIYDDFVTFLRDLEKSLRIVDIDSISFSTVAAKNIYRYDFKIRTYWLKK